MDGQIVCVENIGPRESRKRLLMGLVLFLVALGAGVTLIMTGAARIWRLFLFPVIWGAAVGYYQARERTCVVLARRGARNLDRGIEVVSDPAVVAASRRQAQKVTLLASVTAVVATLILLLAPAA